MQSRYTLGQLSNLTSMCLTIHLKLFQWHWYYTFLEYSEEHCCSNIETVHFQIFKEHWKLFQCETLILCKNIESCSSAKLWYCARTLKTVPVWTFNLWISKNPEHCSSTKLWCYMDIQVSCAKYWWIVYLHIFRNTKCTIPTCSMDLHDHL